MWHFYRCHKFRTNTVYFILVRSIFFAILQIQSCPVTPFFQHSIKWFIKLMIRKSSKPEKLPVLFLASISDTWWLLNQFIYLFNSIKSKWRCPSRCIFLPLPNASNKTVFHFFRLFFFLFSVFHCILFFLFVRCTEADRICLNQPQIMKETHWNLAKFSIQLTFLLFYYIFLHKNNGKKPGGYHVM